MPTIDLQNRQNLSHIKGLIKTALVHDWLMAQGGAERVLKAMHELYPGNLHVLMKKKSFLKNSIWHHETIHTSFLQCLPFAEKAYRYFLPLFPYAIEQFDLSRYDLILSSSHAVAKNVLTHPHQLHICYCHTPMRYAWDLYHTYIKELRGIKKMLAQKVLHSLRTWDSAATHRIDHFIANSHYVARRIKKIYNRESIVIYPPVATHNFALTREKENFYLTVSRLVPYKKIDLIVRAFAHMPEKKLLIIGEGPEMAKIKRLSSANTEFLGLRSDEHVRNFMAKARACIFAAEEDFGIASVEAQAMGTPVIAYGKGGALETVQEGVTGLFFKEQSVESLCSVIQDFEKKRSLFNPNTIRIHAQKFSEGRFKEEYRNYVELKLGEFYENHHPCRR